MRALLDQAPRHRHPLLPRLLAVDVALHLCACARDYLDACTTHGARRHWAAHRLDRAPHARVGASRTRERPSDALRGANHVLPGRCVDHAARDHLRNRRGLHVHAGMTAHAALPGVP